MWKRMVCIILVLLISFSCRTAAYAGGGDGSDSESFTDAWAAAAPAENEDALRERLRCSSAILIECSTGEILYEMNADEPMPPASITKIMTLLLVMEALERGEITLDTVVSASEHACSMGGSQIWLEPGEQMTVNDLLKATAIQSANDTSVALAELIGSSEEGFVQMMNDRARELGMTNTTFKNASGLDEDGHLTTARDIAVMSAELLRHDLIREYVTIWMDTLRGGETGLTNTNKLLKSYKGTTGLKTGTTDGAGKCLSASALRDGMELIAVTMGSPSSDERFSSAKALLDYGFGHWQIIQPESVAEQLLPVPVKKGVEKQVLIEETEIPSLLVKRGQAGNVESRLTVSPELEAPVQAGQKAGEVEILLDGVCAAKYDLITSSAVDRMNFWVAFVKLLEAAFSF